MLSKYLCSTKHELRSAGFRPRSVFLFPVRGGYEEIPIPLILFALGLAACSLAPSPHRRGRLRQPGLDCHLDCAAHGDSSIPV